ncbi:hypothetical protein Nepgr_021423 [Nepenthes gracilis]|uniref:Uncharacterized protein n=1 Tax=Nepenthes gracilis TaxID=150966 RepID=A0AAD3SYS4_NEPGR|nr:hypothetical protein Nepgr_021423 [Nepenthes gracilis]
MRLQLATCSIQLPGFNKDVRCSRCWDMLSAVMLADALVWCFSKLLLTAVLECNNFILDERLYEELSFDAVGCDVLLSSWRQFGGAYQKKSVSQEDVVVSPTRREPAAIVGVDYEAVVQSSPVDGLPSGFFMEGSSVEVCDDAPTSAVIPNDHAVLVMDDPCVGEHAAGSFTRPLTILVDAIFADGSKEAHQPSLSSDLFSDQKSYLQINNPSNQNEGSPGFQQQLPASSKPASASSIRIMSRLLKMAANEAHKASAHFLRSNSAGHQISSFKRAADEGSNIA